MVETTNINIRIDKDITPVSKFCDKFEKKSESPAKEW